MVIVKYVESLHTQLVYLFLLVALLILYAVFDSMGVADQAIGLGISVGNVLFGLSTIILVLLLYHSSQHKLLEDELNALLRKL